eukprot:4016576-Pleurochrysis_carterae.AAC.1
MKKRNRSRLPAEGPATGWWWKRRLLAGAQRGERGGADVVASCGLVAKKVVSPAEPPRRRIDGTCKFVH